MPGYSGRDLHVNKALMNVAISYKPEGMIAPDLYPVVEVDKQSDAYNIWNIADAYAITDSRRAPATEANRIRKGVSSGTFYCQNYALRDDLPIEDIQNMDADKLAVLRGNKVEFIMDDLMLGWEQRVANQVNSTSNVGSSGGVSSGWSDKTSGNSDPIGDVETAMNNVQDSTGVKPNKIVMSLNAWRNFKRHADVVSAIYGDGPSMTGGPRFASKESSAKLFGVDKFMVGESYYNSAQEGQNASLTKFWGENTFVFYTPDRPSKDRPSFGYAFRWTGGKLQNWNVRKLPYNENIQAESIEVGYYQDERITASALGFLITNCNSSA